MSKMYVTEYTNGGSIEAGNKLVAPAAHAGTDQAPVTFTTTAQSAAFGANTVAVQVHVDGIASIAFGTNPAATTNNMRLNANDTRYFFVPPGQNWKVAAVTNT